MDGTLLNTEDIYTEAASDLLALYGKGPLTWDVKIKLQGLPGPKANEIMILHYQLPLTVDEFTEKNMEIQSTKWHKTDYLPGAKQLLESLKEHKIPIALGTSSNVVNLNRKTDHLPDFKNFFGPHITTGDDTRIPKGKGKPEPFIWYVCLGSLNDERKQQGLEPIKPEECLIFEDGIPGVLSGLRSDGHVIWIPHPDAHEHIEPMKQKWQGEKLAVIDTLETFEWKKYLDI